MKEEQLSNERRIYVLYSFDIYQMKNSLNTNIIQNGRNCTGIRYLFVYFAHSLHISKKFVIK